jgi:hypothetical protein
MNLRTPRMDGADVHDGHQVIFFLARNARLYELASREAINDQATKCRNNVLTACEDHGLEGKVCWSRVQLRRVAA